MITRANVVQTLQEGVPSFRDRWERHVARWEGQEAGLFNDVGQFAHHLVWLYETGRSDELATGLEVVETLLLHGDAHVQELASIGILEDVQNIASHRPFGYEVFVPLLGPTALTHWRRLEQTWRGRTSLAEVLAAEAGSAPPRTRRPWWALWRRKVAQPQMDVTRISNPELREIAEELTRLYGDRGDSGDRTAD